MPANIERIQGTDGIRREVALASDPRVRGLGPLRALLERDLLTEEFFELYAYAFARDLVDLGALKRGAPIAIAWDGRDRDETFVGAALDGLAKAGARPHLLGVAPSPAVPLEMAYTGCAGGLMITASHNPANQNGIKAFYAPLGAKPLPADDARLTRRLFALEPRRLLRRRAALAPRDLASEARERFIDLLLQDLEAHQPQSRQSFAPLAVVVDAANGALSGLAAETFRRAGIAEVIEVNADPSRGVNRGGGAADLEGVESLAPSGLERSGTFRDHRGLRALLEAGQRRGAKRLTAAAVFDADGDRLHLVLYDPWEKLLRVMSGDDLTALQALGLGPGAGRIYAATIESDLAALTFAAQHGFRPVLTAVGDKWLLREALRCELRDRARRADPALRRRLRAAEERVELSAAECLTLSNLPPPPARSSFGLGGEMTGHTIRALSFEDAAGQRQRVYAGNALLAALHSLAALGPLIQQPSAAAMRRAHDPTVRGFKASAYTYFSNQAALKPRRLARARLAAELGRLVKAAFPLDSRIRARYFPEEPELLYLEARVNREVRAAAFVRNSGTEDKTGAHVRGSRKDERRLRQLLDKLALLLQIRVKQFSKPGAQATLRLLAAVRDQQLPEAARDAQSEAGALLKVLQQKEGLIAGDGAGGLSLTPRGQALLELMSAGRGARPAP